MFLTPPDCPQSVAVLQIIHSLKQLQRYTNHIFSNANQRLGKCQERINLQLRRIEVIEKKVETLEQVDEIPVFHCAPRHPELCFAGFCQPVFGKVMVNLADVQDQTNNANYELDLLNGVYKPEPLKIIKDGIERKKNAGHFAQKSQKFDNSDLNGPLQSDAKIHKLNLTKLFTADMSRKFVSAQLDFSDSLLEGLETLTSSIGKETFSIGNEIVEANLLATLDCSQANVFDSLGEKVEFDLPEDLPVFDTKSLGTRSVSTLFRSDEHLSSKTEAPKILCIPDESDIRERPKLDSCGFEDKIRNDVVSPPIIPSVEASSLPQIQAPPPPPPPPPLQQAKAISGRSDLMAAIRATGGVKGAGLKSVKMDDDQLENSNTKKNVEEDLMTSLTRVLAMRRRGISGRRNPSNSKSMGDVLRENIPTRSRTGSSSGEDQNSNEVGPNEWVDE